MQLRDVRRLVLVVVGLCLLAQSARAQSSVTLQAADGGLITAVRWQPDGVSKGAILLFHQAGSNLGEYAPIGPRLARLGYDVTAIDQRSGGNAFGRANATVAQRGRASGFLASLPDLEAALADARKRVPGKPAVVVGSSYSAALVFLLAAAHPSDVAAIVAFSPGEYLSGVSVSIAAAKVTAPVFVASAADTSEVAAAADILAASPAKQKEQFIPKVGPHGASLLRLDSNPDGADAAWAALEAFLARVD